MGWYEESQQRELERIKSVCGLSPIPNPMGDDHHTDADFTAEDLAIGQIAYFLGKIIDADEAPRMSSRDYWCRIARALRIHGLKIVNIQQSVPTTTPSSAAVPPGIPPCGS
jgi:hypothetical protein